MNREIDLAGNWEFKRIDRGQPKLPTWIPATVPGTVHTDLLANHLINDPFDRDNELKMGWIEEADWLYRRRIKVSAEFLRDANAVWLECDGLDTFATIRINGRKVGTADNMFRPWRFDVRRQLKQGSNTIEIIFDSPTRIAEARAKKHEHRFHTVNYPYRMHTRKAQYAGGWDWGPRLITSGIWRPIRLRAVRHAELRDIHIITQELSDRQALLKVKTEIESHVTDSAILDIQVTCLSTGRIFNTRRKVSLKPGRQTSQATVTINEPRLWWPAGLGEPSLHDVNVTLLIDDHPADAGDRTIGLRTAELIREPDAQGESFRFRINGRDVFCRGANWIPGDSFLPRFSADKYRQRLADALQANMNMVRVWGGGIYEDPAFYRTCDELGLMVWQDFMFACSEYPDDKTMCDTVQAEAIDIVRQLRNHPSIVIWCGNNENEWLYERRWPESPRFFGHDLFHRVLPTVCKRHDPTRPYWPGSPWGGDAPNDPNRGNQHIWTVWSFWAPPEEYLNWPARFVTEFGFQGMPDTKTVRSFTSASDRKLFSPVLDLHNKMIEGHPRMMKYIISEFGMPRDLDAYIYLTQLMQLDVIKLGVEYWRRRWPDSAGAIFWQLNDCWPVMSWSAIDYYGRPKGLWYGARRFFAPTLVTISPSRRERNGLNPFEVWLHHDHDDRAAVRVEIIGWQLDGKRLGRQVIDTRLPRSATQRVATCQPGELKLTDPTTDVVQVIVRQGRQILASNFATFLPTRYMKWPRPKFAVRIQKCDEGFEIEAESRQVARAVRLEATRYEGRFDDNWFDLTPGQKRRIRWIPAAQCPDLSAFKRNLSIDSLATFVD